ncbi:MAG TPA: hypothetical protein VM511_02790 [Luteolibacter sp.]|nr:hypothetical protein [Luteolibacter sp.]
MKTAWCIAGIAIFAATGFVVYPKPETSSPEKSPARSREHAKRKPVIPTARAAPDHLRNANRLFAGKEWKLLNDAVEAWFEADPAAAREWIASIENLEPLEPAIARISAAIGRTGEAALALQWVELLQPGPEKDRSLHDIYALAARNRQLTDEQLRAAPLPPEEIERLLSRTADD